MKSTLDNMEGLSRRLRIEVPADRVQVAFNDALKSIQKEATVKGFRKGKAPIATIKSIYGDRVKSDLINDLINEGYQSALNEHSLDPVSYPSIHFDAFDLEKPFAFTAEFEIRPEVKLNKFEGLSLEKEILDIPEDRLDGIMKNICESHAEYGPMLEDRGLAQGDFAEIDFEGFIEFKPLEGAKAEKHLLEIGGNRFIPGFEEGLIGLKPGQHREVNIQFPADYHNEELRSKPVSFKVYLHAIKRKSIPVMSDEIAQKAGPYKSVAELKEAVLKDLKEGEERRIQEESRNKILRELVKQNPVQVPKSLLDQQKKYLISDVQKKMQQQGLGEAEFKDYVSKWDGDFNETAAFMVQSTFLVDALAQQLNVRATPQDIEKKIDEYASQTGIERDKLKDFYSKSERRSRLSFQITEERVVDYLISKANVREVKASKAAE